MDNAALYQALGAIIQDQPEIDDSRSLMRWLGRAQALVSKVSSAWAIEIQVASSMQIANDPWQVLQRTNAVLYRALAVVEVDAPVQHQGSFIQAGNDLDALSGVSKVLNTATHSVRIVDPYMDELVLTDFAVLALEQVAIELLTDDGYVKASFKPAVTRFRKQFNASRPLEARITASGLLHDRLIFIDGREVYSVTQSLKDLAKRSHASIIRVEPELAGLKISAYENYWNAAAPI